MKRGKIILILFFVQLGNLAFSGEPANKDGMFTLVSKQKACNILIDQEEDSVVTIAATLYANDILHITGKKPVILNEKPEKEKTFIIAGTLGKSKWIKKLSSEGKVDIASIKGKWETFSIQVINRPFPSYGHILLIMGSDRRGTAYGILELSRMIGVSPWEWWADVAPKKQKELSISVRNKIFGPPSVKYRGIFLNDEDWGLQRWAALTYEPETGDIGPKTYAKIFELMLRLKANTIWPAMHSCTKPFYSYPENKIVADKYAIVVGTSHCEPMLCNINSEWNDKAVGEWRYDTNSQRIQGLFEKRVKESAPYESIYTMGIRGEHDSPMIVGNQDSEEQIKLLEKVINDQRQILKTETGKVPATIPQAFIPYKEVLTYYQEGLKVPEDITLVWTDDNYGYIRQLSTPKEQKRTGGAGIYYHTSYWGRPHDYLWLNSTNPVLLWEEMNKAYQFNARNLWILNCGDIKPLEYNIELFLDMAWDISRFPSSQSIHDHMKSWYAAKFGTGRSQEITDLMEKYFSLCYTRRPEFMAWSQTEPTTKPEATELNQVHYHDELEQRLDAWQKLNRKAEELYSIIPENQKAAFYQLLYYPITGASLINQKWLYYYKNLMEARQDRSSALWCGKQSEEAFARIVNETRYFNEKLSNGKWNHIMSMSPRNLPVFKEPSMSVPAYRGKAKAGLSLEGYEMEVNHDIINSYSNVLPVFNAYTRDSAFMDIFLKGEGEIKWKAIPKDPWISLSHEDGILNSFHGRQEQRIWVRLIWPEVPRGKSAKETPLGHDYQLIPPGYKITSSIDIVTPDTTFTIGISAYNPEFSDLENFKGFVEGQGYVSINAEDYNQAKDGNETSWQTIDGLGYSGKVIIPLPYSAPSIANTQDIINKSPVLEYNFYTFNFGEANVHVQAVPTHPFYEGRGVRCAVAIDDSDPVIIDFHTFGRSQEWKQNVLKNAARKSAKQIISKAGKHTLKIWMVDPGVMIDQILIDLGGWKDSYAFPPETNKL